MLPDHLTEYETSRISAKSNVLTLDSFDEADADGLLF